MSKKKIVFFTLIIASAFIINNLVHSIYILWQKQNLVVQAQRELVKEKKENEELKKKLTAAKTSQFVEEEARDKLFMAKPGESVVVLPTNYLQVRPSVTPVPTDNRPNWKKWWDMFF